MSGAAVLGIVLGRWWPNLLPVPHEAGGQENDEASYYISRNSVTLEPAPLLKPTALTTAVGSENPPLSHPERSRPVAVEDCLQNRYLPL